MLPVVLLLYEVGGIGEVGHVLSFTLVGFSSHWESGHWVLLIRYFCQRFIPNSGSLLLYNNSGSLLIRVYS